MDESNTSTLELTGSISKATLQNLIKKVESGKANGKKKGSSDENASSEEKQGVISNGDGKKKKATPTGFATPIDNLEEYETLIKKMKDVIGNLWEASVVNVGLRSVVADSYNGTPSCIFYCWSIPHNDVGKTQAEGKTLSPSKFYGTFHNEDTMIAYLRDELSLPIDHVLVQNSAEFYGILPSLETKWKNPIVSSAFANQRANCGTKSGKDMTQVGRSKKVIANCWYFHDNDSGVPKHINVFNTNGFVHRRTEVDFYNYENFLEAKESFKKQRDATMASNSQWVEYINQKGGASALEKLEELRPSKKRRSNTSPRNDEEIVVDEIMDEGDIPPSQNNNPKKKRKVSSAGPSPSAPITSPDRNLKKTLDTVSEKVGSKGSNVDELEHDDDDDEVQLPVVVQAVPVKTPPRSSPAIQRNNNQQQRVPPPNRHSVPIPSRENNRVRVK